MKLLSRQNGQFEFRLARRERELVVALLGHYPLLPTGYHPPGTEVVCPDPEGAQMLDELLVEHKAAARQAVQHLLKEKLRPREDLHGWGWSLTEPDIDLLIEVFNEVRVGAWHQLGCPADLDAIALRDDSRRGALLWAMEVSGAFVSFFLELME
jgi:hypothetical protein